MRFLIKSTHTHKRNTRELPILKEKENWTKYQTRHDMQTLQILQKALIRSFLFVRIQFIPWTVEHYHFHSRYMIRDVAIRVQIPEDFLCHSLFYDIIKGPWQWKNDTAMFTLGAWSESKDLEIFCDTEIMINHIILQVHDPWCGGESPRTWGLPGGDDISVAHSGPQVSRWDFLGFSIWLGQYNLFGQCPSSVFQMLF